MVVDILAIGAHPDDVELAMAGSILVFSKLGRKTAVIDLTRGELGTRGTVEIRTREAQIATQILGLSARENLELPDGRVADTDQNRLALVGLIRKYRPRLIFTHHHEDLSGHPDHHACSRLVEHAAYLSGLARIETADERSRPRGVVFFSFPRYLTPTFVVDVTPVYTQAREALVAYQSQFHNPESKDPETYLSNPHFIPQLQAAHRFFGAMIGVEYGEAFWCPRPPMLSDPTVHF